MPKLSIAGATVNQIPLDWSGNLANIIQAIDEARKSKVDILNLPELCITGYGCEDMFLSQWVCDRALDCIETILPKTSGMTVLVGLPLAQGNKTYNAAFVLRNEKLIGVYCKRHLPREGVHYETRWFDSWPEGEINDFTYREMTCPMGDISLELHGIKIGFEICEDAWREERPADKFNPEQIDLILNPSASHFAFGKADFRENLVIESSARYKCFYLYTNLLGNESGRMIFDGDIILAGMGKLIQRNQRLSFENLNLLVSTIDFDSGEVTSEPVNPWIESQNEEFAQAASLALFDYMRKSRSQGFVLSLSGGADSSTCAVLVAEMVRRATKELGVERFLEKLGIADKFKNNPETSTEDIVTAILHTAYQGTKNSSDETFKSAQELANSLGAWFYDWKIDEEVASYTSKIEQALGTSLSWDNDDITLQNIQARARSPIIWMIANIKHCLLLTTSNRSEGDVGYATMDGDTSGSLAPIAAVDKPFILQWLKWAQEELGYSGLERVNSLQPSAELRPAENTQTDEADLMPYVLLLEIEKLAIRDKRSPVEIYEAITKLDSIPNDLLKQYIQKFFRLWAQNQWKRERIAPSFHFDEFNVDPRSWMRFPILSSGFKEELAKLDAL